VAWRLSRAEPGRQLVGFAAVARRIPILTVAIAAAGALALSGCGAKTGVVTPDGAALDNGKKQFQQKCGGCHTLADAGTKGTIGPNLDYAYLQPRMNGFDDTSFEALVREQIMTGFEYADPPMPANLVTGKDANDVAAYVAKVAAVDLVKQLQKQQ
jgi:mono/diheme cytochrome c family protein